ncbi:hypothetical protein AVJ23_11670 [Pseudoponticoccus marisrubri]|uniref:Phytase-like domain-containing protein n=2 Tax=Pseudoponticoccus marisrubri TaxID=1685382 RepID=A0A0W7WJG6_9RHOB|nr:hypothetical protein AVJ23_11670 [Pseudoponticoccus marisrubri]
MPACYAGPAPDALTGGPAYVGSYTWPAAAHDLGGFSGLEVTEDGTGFTVISDRSGRITGRFRRENGTITGIEAGPPAPLTRPDGTPLTGWRGDSEGLATGSDGTAYISFEGDHRVWAYPDFDAATPLARPEAFTRLQGNSGFEALAIDAQGRLFAIPERSGALSRPFPVWRYADGRWEQPFTLSRSGNFLPVGADFGPDGALYLLERTFTGLGFRTRIRRFTIDGDRVAKEETLLTTPLLRHDNLEGIAVWQDPTGALRLTLVSDDNFRALQRTEFVEYRLPR